VLVGYFVGPAPMDLQFWPGVLLLMVYAIFAATLYLLPPRIQ
jgi:Ca2+:H+ antiporter